MNFATSSNSCSKYDTVTVVIKPKPVNNILGDINILSGATHQYEVTSTNGSSYNWIVSGGNISSGSTTNKITVQWDNVITSGFVKLIETNQQGCVSDTALLNITLGSNTLNVNPSYIGATNSASTTELVVTSTQNWNVSADQIWMTLNKTNGANNDTVVVSIQANTTSLNRQGYIVFTSGSLTFIVPVSQVGTAMQDMLLLNKDTVKVNSYAHQIDITITCNRSWLVSSEQSWVTPSLTTGGGNTVIQLKIDSNTGVERTATVTVTAGLLKKTIYISQSAVSSGINNISANSIMVFPNPATGIIHISGDAVIGAKQVEVKLLDMQGKQVTLTTETTVDVSGVKTGIYFLYCTIDGKLVVKKVSIINQ